MDLKYEDMEVIEEFGSVNPIATGLRATLVLTVVAIALT